MLNSLKGHLGCGNGSILLQIVIMIIVIIIITIIIKTATAAVKTAAMLCGIWPE